ncbi:MAG: M13 family metallopeptidase [Candidatus Xenobia bacterium]
MEVRALSSFRALAPTPSAPTASSAEPQDQVQIKGIDLSNLDPSVRPQDDFFHYADGGYLKTHPIPPDKGEWGAFTKLRDDSLAAQKDVVEAAAKSNAPAGSNDQKIGDFYRSAMDTDAINQAGAKPLQPEFDRIAALSSKSDLQAEIAHLHREGLDAVFGFGGGQDPKNPSQIIAQASQSGLGLPDREYYVVDNDANRKVRAAYVDHMTKMFGLLGDTPQQAAEEARKVMGIETLLAQISLSDEKLRDPNATYNIMKPADIPGIDFPAYLKAMGRPDIDKVDVATPDFFAKLGTVMRDVPLDDWKSYLRWKVLDPNSAYLSKPFSDENFNFNGKILGGLQQPPERWKSVMDMEDRFLGEAVGQKYVEKYFPPETKKAALDMVHYIQQAARDKINGADWMSEGTKKEALAKVDNLMIKIGYPDKWKDYSGLSIDRGLLVNNVMRARQFAARQDLADIGQPNDRTKWGMTPQTVNAYYNPTNNEIVFPAAILQPPFFDAKADPAQNFGGIGAVIGHELTHGFDDEGSHFDSTGKLRDWMSPADRARFTARQDGVANEFDQFVYDGQKVSGKKVEGEATADLGGVELSYDAFKLATAGQPPAKSGDGFTPDQRYFVSYANIWAENIRPQTAHELITEDVHPLPQFRVNGTLENIPAFYTAFNVKPGDAMMADPAKRNHLWT